MVGVGYSQAFSQEVACKPCDILWQKYERKTKDSWGWGAGSAVKMLAMQAVSVGLEFRCPTPVEMTGGSGGFISSPGNGETGFLQLAG